MTSSTRFCQIDPLRIDDDHIALTILPFFDAFVYNNKKYKLLIKVTRLRTNDRNNLYYVDIKILLIYGTHVRTYSWKFCMTGKKFPKK